MPPSRDLLNGLKKPGDEINRNIGSGTKCSGSSSTTTTTTQTKEEGVIDYLVNAVVDLFTSKPEPTTPKANPVQSNDQLRSKTAELLNT